MQQILERAAVAECALMVGSSQGIMDATTEYSKTRVAFGVPIGSFEVVKHRLADMLADLYGSQYITYQAAWRIDEGLPCTKEASFAKAWVNEAHRRICLGGNQTHGGIGYTWDHDIGLYWRRSKPAEISFGDADHHLKVVAEQIGL